EKGSNDRPFRIDVFTIATKPLNITQQMRQILLSISPEIVPNVLTTDRQPYRRREGVDAANPRRRVRSRQRAGGDWLRQGLADRNSRRRSCGGRDRRSCPGSDTFFSGCGRDLRRWRLRRQGDDPATRHSGGLPAQLAMLVGQWRLFARRRRAVWCAARVLRG